MDDHSASIHQDTPTLRVRTLHVRAAGRPTAAGSPLAEHPELCGLAPTSVLFFALCSVSTRLFSLPESRLFLVIAAYLTLCECHALANQLSLRCGTRTSLSL
eukprot:3364117-Pleurochrysis_carterae.AAC.1